MNYSYTDMRTKIAQFVVDKRQELNMSQEALAEKALIHISTVYCLERSNFNIKLSTLLAIARAFEIEIKEIFE